MTVSPLDLSKFPDTEELQIFEDFLEIHSPHMVE